jgi:hypothetical protein
VLAARTWHAMPPPSTTFDSDEAIAKLEAQGVAIRALKQSKAPKEEIVEAVALLNALKLECERAVIARLEAVEAQLCSDSPSAAALQGEAMRLRNFLPSAAKQAKEKQIKKSKKSRAAAERQKFDRARFTNTVRTQRKIHHLLSHDGSGDSFEYDRTLAGGPTSAFTPGTEVFFTEKWDGTTVQATCEGIFKRKELLQRGSSAKFDCKDEAERYDIERINLEDPAYKYIAAACAPYMDMFAALPKGLCVYFEAVGSRIAGSKQRFCQGVRPVQAAHASCGPGDPKHQQQTMGYIPYAPVATSSLHGTGIANQSRVASRYLPLPPITTNHSGTLTIVGRDNIARGVTALNTNCGSADVKGVASPFAASLLQLNAIIANLEGVTDAAIATAASDAAAAAATSVIVHDAIDWSDIRVFDFARDKVFLPFEETIRLASEYKLPLVGFKRQRMPDLSLLLDSLSHAAAAEKRHAMRARTVGQEPHSYQPIEQDDRLLYNDVAAEMEGYVLRLIEDGETVAKIRVEDMDRLK